MQGKLFKRFTHLLYCSVLSLGGNVNTRRRTWDSSYTLKLMTYSDQRKLLCKLSKLSKLNAFILQGY